MNLDELIKQKIKTTEIDRILLSNIIINIYSLIDRQDFSIANSIIDSYNKTYQLDKSDIYYCVINDLVEHNMTLGDKINISFYKGIIRYLVKFIFNVDLKNEEKSFATDRICDLLLDITYDSESIGSLLANFDDLILFLESISYGNRNLLEIFNEKMKVLDNWYIPNVDSLVKNEAAMDCVEAINDCYEVLNNYKNSDKSKRQYK